MKMSIEARIIADASNQIKDLETQLKAKDREIDRLYTENKKLMGHITMKNLSEPIVFCAKCSSEIIIQA